MIQVDYSENHHNKNEDVIQSTYFGHQTFSVLTACDYFCPGEMAEKVQLSSIKHCESS